MKIKTVKKNYSEVLQMPRAPHKNPHRPSRALWGLVSLISKGDLKATNFTYTTRDMDKAGDGPWLILMNHSSFLDFEIAAKLLKKHPFSMAQACSCTRKPATPSTAPRRLCRAISACSSRNLACRW